MFDQTARLGLLCSLVWLEYVGIVAGNKNIKNPWKVERLQSAHQKTLGGGNSIFFHFHLYLGGRWTHFDDHIFQMGWFNHQPELLVFFGCFLCWWYTLGSQTPPQTPGHDRLVLWASFELHLVVRLPVFGGETSCFGGETSCFWWWNFLFLVVKLPVFGGETSYRLTKKDGSLKFNRGVSITVPYCTYIGGIKQMQMYIW